jgi:hypothetical protein
MNNPSWTTGHPSPSKDGEIKFISDYCEVTKLQPSPIKSVDMRKEEDSTDFFIPL